MDTMEHARPLSGVDNTAATTPTNSNRKDEGTITPQGGVIHSLTNSALLPRAEKNNRHWDENLPSQQTLLKKAHRPLRYRKRSLVLLACYLPFLIIPWVFTCVMAIRPLGLPSYYNQKGEYGPDMYLVIQFWMGCIRVLNSIASILTIPIVSALLAQGAVVYAQRKKVKQKLSLRQTLTLADRGWNDLPTLWKAFQGIGTSSIYLWLAAGLLLLSLIQAPIQQAIVSIETISIMTSQDLPFYNSNNYLISKNHPTTLAYDPEPYDLARIPRDIVVKQTAKNLGTLTEMDVQWNLWHEQDSDEGDLDLTQKANSNTFFWYYSRGINGSIKMNLNRGSYFVSAMPNDTSTGILREHAMRLNSTVQCNPISESAFPSTCSGSHPFETSFKSNSLSIDICVPGDYTGLTDPPWTLSRDRQDVQEQLYLKVHVSYPFEFFEIPFSNFTIQCSANTTRGYFELSNIRNNLVPGGLMERWPDNKTMWNEYNDYVNIAGSFDVPGTINDYSESEEVWVPEPSSFNTLELVTPGPLMTSTLAMFGNESFFYTAKNYTNSSTTYPMSQICQTGSIPFARLLPLQSMSSDYYEFICELTEYSDLEQFLYNWFTIFNSTGWDLYNSYYAKQVLEVAMFKANEVWLTETAAATTFFNARKIYTSPGSTVFRPSMTTTGIIIVSVLLGLQVTGLLVLAWYIYTMPTWTATFDSMAVAQLTKSVDDHIPPIGYTDNEALRKLQDVDGLVGIAEDDVASASETSEIGGESHHRNVEQSTTKAKFNLGDEHLEMGSTRDEDASIGISSVTTLGGMIRLARGGPGLITKAYTLIPTKRSWWH